MSSPQPLTPTSYALLGLLAVKPWTTYELARQMDRTLSRFWPRARSKLYEEPKKLVAHGLARASEERVGKRPRTVYSITRTGRRALADWLAQPGDGPLLEFEQLLKVFYCENGSRGDLLRTLHDVKAWVHERTLENIEVALGVLEGRSPFPQRDAGNQLVGAFLEDLNEALDRWADWAIGVVETWPDATGEAKPDLVALEEALHRGLDRAARWRATRDATGPGTRRATRAN